MSHKSMTRLLLGFGASLLFVSAGGALAQSEQQTLVDRADKTLSNFLRDPDMTWLQRNIGRAKAVMIAPEVVNLAETVINPSADWNEPYYKKKPVLPPDILVRMSAHNKGGDKLLADVGRAAGKK